LPPKNDKTHDKPARVAAISQEMNPAAYEGRGPFDHDEPMKGSSPEDTTAVVVT